MNNLIQSGGLANLQETATQPELNQRGNNQLPHLKIKKKTPKGSTPMVR